MYQIYFLSILANVIAGIALAFDRMDERMRLHAVFNPEMFKHTGFRLAMGVIAFVVGFLKLLSVTPGTPPVVGDLFPAVAGMLMGFALCFQYYQERTEVTSAAVESLDRVFGRHSANLGMIGVFSGVLHFFLHRVLFL
ncbi:hypothetical protein AU468_08690 [Alkalispirochaeta sphaeroplastigenens]|uniref:Uncharacterized protein n=1 Tax=Alkalispirochaeta sphaeroplastigenens TaxID=1187066 RepID=A0A2S4JNQ4_9SPIO|nr:MULTISPECIES: hypothetical protein [Alkalispirochaeta]POR01151.1 hypothetical protein AU468_08690 [Alkalispirochaeta sphaeroplastigenens]